MVYPRWRGEHPVGYLSAQKLCGLSPLARGTLFDLADMEDPQRFIPAGAGNTVTVINFPSSEAVYPRWRGEHGCLQTAHFERVGLSPLARGTPARLFPRYQRERFIPAGAGNTTGQATATRSKPVYPRWRGEHLAVVAARAWYSGLSPLARGTPFKNGDRLAVPRFIPAGAGNTSLPAALAFSSAVYPRWRGEH